MLIGKLLNRIKDEDLKECLAVGLAGGLAVGLAGGLVFGLAGGLAVGLAGGLVFGLAEIYQFSIESFIIVLIFILIISEVLFWLDKHRWDDIGRWGNTILKKGESLFESSVVIINSINVFNHYDDILIFFNEQQETVKSVLYCIGWGGFGEPDVCC